MYLIIALLCFGVYLLFGLNDKGKAIAKHQARTERLSGGGTFIHPYKEYQIHCGNVALVDQMIKDEQRGMEITEEDEKERTVGNMRWGDEYMLKRKAERIISTRIFGVDYFNRDQIAYYYTCKEVISRGMKTNLMWGKPDVAEAMTRNLIKWFVDNTPKCGGYKGYNAIGIGYPVHSSPEPGIEVHFTDNSLSRPEVYNPDIDHTTILQKYGLR